MSADRLGLERAIGEWAEWLAVLGRSPNTVETRQRSVRRLQVWLAERGITQTGEVSRRVLERYQRHLFHVRQANGRPLAFATQRNQLAAIRGFFRWAASSNRVLYNPAAELQLPRPEQRIPNVLTAEQVELVLLQPDLDRPGGVRDRAMLEVLYSTGIRRGELASLELWDLDADREILSVRQGKGRRDRVVPIGERALVWCARYLSDARPALVAPPDDGVLFVGDDGRRFGLTTLSARVARHVERSGVASAGACHLFRHTMATLMLEAGADVRQIQVLLGHANVETTSLYTHVGIAQLQAVHRATHPASGNQRHRDRGLDHDHQDVDEDVDDESEAGDE